MNYQTQIPDYVSENFFNNFLDNNDKIRLIYYAQPLIKYLEFNNQYYEFRCNRYILNVIYKLKNLKYFDNIKKAILKLSKFAEKCSKSCPFKDIKFKFLIGYKSQTVDYRKKLFVFYTFKPKTFEEELKFNNWLVKKIYQARFNILRNIK